MAIATTLLSIQQLSVTKRVDNVTFEHKRGELLGLIGANGAGKSTLLHALVGLEPSSGDIMLNGRSFDAIPPYERARIVSIQPQMVSSAWSLTVADIVALGRMPWGDENQSAIKKAMERAGVSDFATRNIDHLSGGERARVWLARVLAGEPQLLLADEPIASLDIHYQLAVMEVLKQYTQESRGVIVAIHDLSLAARFCDRLCLMHRGKMIAIGTPAEVLTEKLLSTAYGVPVDIDLERNPPVVLPK
ncbi:MAG: ABC transporter ATP-binding protein [Gammaproteobacteria bacterium]|nr:ABC transporter ATP-binding protein [Gammaproteobacteria bacterium]